MSFTYDVFLSHSAKDKAVVRDIATRLKKDGLEVWFDEWEIKPGDNIPAKIEAGLQNSHVLALCMSANAFGSDWAQLESQTFLFRDPLNKDRRFIPLRLDDAPIKGSLSQFLYIDWQAGDQTQEFWKLLEACRQPEPKGDLTPAQSQLLTAIETLGHTDRVRSVAWSADGKWALSGSDDRTVRVWEVSSGQCKRVLEGHKDSVRSVAWSADGKWALSGSADRTVRVWEVGSGQCERVLEGHTDRVWSVAWSADGKRALSGSDDLTVRVWEVGSGQCERVLKGHTDWVWSVAWSADGKRALSGSADRTVRVWEVGSGQCERVLKGHKGWVWSVAWSADGKWALSGSDDLTVRVWEVSSGQCKRVLEGHKDSVRSVAWSADGKWALSGSDDRTVRVWEVGSGQCEQVMEGHTASVLSVAWSLNRERVLSGSEDRTVRVWEVESGKCERVLWGHRDRVLSVVWSPDGQRALSGSDDNTVRVWEVGSGRCERVLEGHTERVLSVAWSGDGKRALSGSDDKTVRVWEVASGQCERVLEGHTGGVNSVAWSGDGKRALSGSEDRTVRVWEVGSGRCERVLEGHTKYVNHVAWSGDGKRALSGSEDNTVRVWEVGSGRCERVLEGHTASVWSVAWSGDGKRAYSAALNGVARVWDLPEAIAEWQSPAEAKTKSPAILDQVQYTNAKVLLVGDTSSGKTGLSHRLATGKWKASDGSTVGAWSTQWPLPDESKIDDLEREIWLWDFGGQADQRLVHQLYMDRAALIVLLFDADKEEALPGLRDWLTALRRCVDHETPRFLVAGRIDAGFKASRAKLQKFSEENRFTYFETSAKEGTGCGELVRAIKETIPWAKLTKRTSPRIFKLLKEEIIKLRDGGQVLHTFKELREELWRRLPNEEKFDDETLQAVVGLLDGPGVVKELEYGTYILLQPEWVNAYAQAVIRTLRQDPTELGCLPVRSIEEGKLIFQSVSRDGGIEEMKRLPKEAERIVLREMEKQLEERGLCLRQGDKLVFPSHCGRDRPAIVEFPSVFVSYRVKGYLDDIYATLIVRLSDSESFKLSQLWREAADFETLNGDHHMGIKLTREGGDIGDISVYFAPGVTPSEQVIFSNYIHAHLTERCEEVQRLRSYVCPHCHTPKGNPEVLMKKLLAKKKEATVVCDICEEKFDLWDDLEKLFASDDIRKQVEGLQEIDTIRLDSRRKGKLLALEVGSRITSANQKCFEIPATEDEEVALELEFTDDDGKGTGRRLYLQLKSGNSHLTRRKNGDEVFVIREPRWVDYWLKQSCPIMLVIGTFAEDEGRQAGREKLEFKEVRWMEISSELTRIASETGEPAKQIVFKGERLDMTSIYKWREKVLSGKVG